MRVVDNSAHIGGLIAGIALALVVPYKRPGEVASSKVWKVAEIVCLAIIAISFVEAFRHYDGPRPSLANLGTDPEKARGQDLGRIKDAVTELVDSLNLFKAILGNRDQSADLSPALRAAERGINALDGLRSRDSSIPRIKEVLTEQKVIIERHGKANPKNWDQTTAEEQALIGKAKGYKLIAGD